ncbi:MAG: cytochrome c biogenesis protein CcmG/thiol:disulfide interchange protein DsbE [Saprospiraceae bacterium]|jgi:cytochrome c biogenesis protein CcmG/thiol:disulfide interchange protein DsbE
MKTNKFAFLVFLLFISSSLINGQKIFPDAAVVDKDGNSFELKSHLKNGKPKLISLWATWCGPCRMELNSLKGPYPGWKEKYDLEILTISVDVPQMIGRAKKMFESNGWDYTFLHDKDQELMNKLNLSGIPYSMLLDGQGNIVSVQMGYSPSYEKMIEQKLKAL